MHAVVNYCRFSAVNGRMELKLNNKSKLAKTMLNDENYDRLV